MKKLYFLRGLPASGKTTWAKKKLATLNRDGVRKAVRTNKDEIRKRLRAKGINSETGVIRREISALILQKYSCTFGKGFWHDHDIKNQVR